MPGFGNDFSTETLPESLPIGRNSPQKCPYGLYAEQLSESPFTAPKGDNERSWLYRIRPSIKHHGKFEAIDAGFIKSGPCHGESALPIGPLRWDPLPIPESGKVDFVSGLTTITASGDVNSQSGMACHIYAVNASMENRYIFDADGELMFVPQLGKMLVKTEMGYMDMEPGEICIVPRGMIFSVEPTEGKARGFVCENYGGKFTLPARGSIGANCLANPRDFLTPVAAYEDKDTDSEILAKWCGKLYRSAIGHSPLDVVAWHGNYAPYKYDLRTFSPVGALLFDHPDPSIYTVLTSPSGVEGTANVDFVIFPDRWSVAENTFRPPWYHRNIMSEFMGLIYGTYDAKPSGFVPGGFSLHNCMLPHGPDTDAFEGASNSDLQPEKMKGSLAFMFETCLPQHLTEFAGKTPLLQDDYPNCWKEIKKYFDPNKRGV